MPETLRRPGSDCFKAGLIWSHIQDLQAQLATVKDQNECYLNEVNNSKQIITELTAQLKTLNEYQTDLSKLRIKDKAQLQAKDQRINELETEMSDWINKYHTDIEAKDEELRVKHQTDSDLERGYNDLYRGLQIAHKKIEEQKAEIARLQREIDMAHITLEKIVKQPYDFTMSGSGGTSDE